MSIHIGAEPGQIAPSILLPGDPRRARFIAETMLDDAVCFNEVRGMLGYTGTYRGERVSVMGTGMGMPSHGIYVHELITEYGVTTLMRVGTCGALQADLPLGEVILAQAASTTSQMNRLRFGGQDFAPVADFDLLRQAHAAAAAQGVHVHVGGVLSADTFYEDDPDWWRVWADFGTLAVEMETAALYTLAARHGVKALALLTVSDNLVSGEAATAEMRERGFPRMVELALASLPGR
ncbi:MAG: purine-nucleoside phosphorylase [Candidatus Krumholzibacteriia bacterium]